MWNFALEEGRNAVGVGCTGQCKQGGHGTGCQLLHQFLLPNRTMPLFPGAQAEARWGEDGLVVCTDPGPHFLSLAFSGLSQGCLWLWLLDYHFSSLWIPSSWIVNHGLSMSMSFSSPNWEKVAWEWSQSRGIGTKDWWTQPSHGMGPFSQSQHQKPHSCPSIESLRRITLTYTVKSAEDTLSHAYMLKEKLRGCSCLIITIAMCSPPRFHFPETHYLARCSELAFVKYRCSKHFQRAPVESVPVE